MTSINPYLTFNGNCREAMTFYQNCLGGDLTLQTVGETPLSEKLPQVMRKRILHASLSNENLVLLGSDMVDEKGLLEGNSVSLVLNCRSKREMTTLFKKLSEGGIANHPPEITFWGALFGGLTDRYGKHWLLHCRLKTKKTDALLSRER